MKTILCFCALSLIGWACFIRGAVLTRRYRAKASRETAMAEATITAYEKKEHAMGRGRTATAYYPVVRFGFPGRKGEAASAHEITATSSFYFLEPILPGDSKPPAEGSAVNVYYDPENPLSFHLEADRNETGYAMMRLGGYIIAFAAAVSIVCGVILKW